MTQEEQAVNYQTQKHILNVVALMNHMVGELLNRAGNHDQSKLENPELDYFVKHTHKLAASTYGSEEYNACLKELKPALDHHYAKNSHHPEHHKNGVNDMTLLDLVEMIADWKSASLRHNDGNIRKSIEINGARFEMSQQLIRIFENTVKELGW